MHATLPAEYVFRVPEHSFDPGGCLQWRQVINTSVPLHGVVDMGCEHAVPPVIHTVLIAAAGTGRSGSIVP
jgi:hypothetical protein